jgi:hypothetical protein
MTGDVMRLKWNKTYAAGTRLDFYDAKGRNGEYVIVWDFNGRSLHYYPPGDRTHPVWEQGPLFGTVRQIKDAAQRHEDREWLNFLCADGWSSTT